MKQWLSLAFSKNVLRRALLTAVVVGAILIAINYGSVILHGQVSSSQLIRMGLTVLVPYCVSTYSSVSTLRSITS